MSEHGTRRCYSSGCRCLCCRAANAKYQEWRRWRHRTGRPPLGTVVSAAEARRRIAQLRAEKVPVAKRLGLKCGSVRLHPDGVTLRRLLKIRQLYRQEIVEPRSQPNHQNP